MEYYQFSESTTGFPGDSTLMLDESSTATLESLSGKVFQMWTGNDYSFATVKPTRWKGRLFKIRLSDGRTLTCSRNQRFFIDNRLSHLSLNEFQQLKKRKRIPKMAVYTNQSNNPKYFNEYDITDVSKIEDNKTRYVVLTLDSTNRCYINGIFVKSSEQK